MGIAKGVSFKQIGARALLLLCFSGCSRSSQPPVAPPAAAPAAAATDALAAQQAVAVALEATNCTLATALIPGIPGSPGHLIPSSINPNGQSELSLLMRTMQADLQRARQAIVDGAPLPRLRDRHARVRCSWPTQPSDRSPEFDRNAQGYLTALAALDATSGSSAQTPAQAFDGVLNACRACHERTCSGAIVAIEALRLSPSPAAAKPH
jgi:hypothetical protein